MLRQGLSGLPKPKNDYEIVVPENEEIESDVAAVGGEGYVQDQADIDEKKEQELSKQSE